MQPRTWMLPVTALTLGSALIFGGPARAAEPLQFSGFITVRSIDDRVFPIGDDSEHAFVVDTVAGANKSTGSTAFLDGALVSHVRWSDMRKGSGPVHGYVEMKASDGSWLMSIDEKSQIVEIDGKPRYTS